MISRRSGTAWIAACLLVAVVVLAGCREDEQDRPLTIQKGEYPGGKPAGLGQEQLNELRARARNQNVN